MSSQSARCPYCGAQATFIFDTKDFNRRIGDETFSYYKCPEDGLIFLNPIPDDLGQYYPSTYYNLDEDPASLEKIYKQVEGYKVDILSQFASGKRLLEVGPGNGAFVYLAQKVGYDVTVIEMDKAACEYLQAKMGVLAVNTNDVVAGLEGLGQFDAIVLWHVIEHIPDAWRALRALSEHLAPDGILILAAPNPQALQFRLFQKFWTHLDAPRHVYLIPADLLLKIGEENGLEPVEKTDLDKGSLMWNRFGWRWSLRNVMQHRVKNHISGWLIEKLISPYERRGFPGATYTVVMRKAVR